MFDQSMDENNIKSWINKRDSLNDFTIYKLVICWDTLEEDWCIV